MNNSRRGTFRWTAFLRPSSEISSSAPACPRHSAATQASDLVAISKVSLERPSVALIFSSAAFIRADRSGVYRRHWPKAEASRAARFGFFLSRAMTCAAMKSYPDPSALWKADGLAPAKVETTERTRFGLSLYAGCLSSACTLASASGVSAAACMANHLLMTSSSLLLAARS
eukprot:scaffold13801_cov162-Isochrysis_galbana.AAC.4